MGILNDFKKLFFGAKSVTTSAKEKAKDEIDEWMEKAPEKPAKEKEETDDLWKAFEERQEKTVDKPTPPAEQIDRSDAPAAEDSQVHETRQSSSDTPFYKEEKQRSKAGEFIEDVGKKVAEASERTGEKIMDFSEKASREIIEKADDAWEKTKEVSESLGSKILGKASELIEKANRAAEEEKSMDENIDEIRKQANRLDDEAKLSDQNRSSNRSSSGDSLLSNHDDFFEKAKKYAEGDHRAFSNKDKQNLNTSSQSGKPGESDKEKLNDLLDNSDAPPSVTGKGTISGYDDNDNDGDYLIDDAIIEDDEK